MKSDLATNLRWIASHTIVALEKHEQPNLNARQNVRIGGFTTTSVKLLTTSGDWKVFMWSADMHRLTYIDLYAPSIVNLTEEGKRYAVVS